MIIIWMELRKSENSLRLRNFISANDCTNKLLIYITVKHKKVLRSWRLGRKMSLISMNWKCPAVESKRKGALCCWWYHSEKYHFFIITSLFIPKVCNLFMFFCPKLSTVIIRHVIDFNQRSEWGDKRNALSRYSDISANFWSAFPSFRSWLTFQICWTWVE